ncbi:hypothetical protein T01_2933 [Trichinella spiralis]|uniref:Uncharacterized protein n=1 Tax=Trichinella spiralis TaxID=6334 RepID=A0A0V1BCJ1_TRISP|nr:hypothetical protein T01_2933 [Trichinella spiralis]
MELEWYEKLVKPVAMIGVKEAKVTSNIDAFPIPVNRAVDSLQL